MNMMTIGQVAKQTGFGVETIRYYERQGLIEAPRRKDSGYRQYDMNTVHRLHFIQQAKGLGFSLAEIHELLSLQVKPGVTSGEIKQLTHIKLVQIGDKIKMLKQMQKVLKKLVNECDGEGPVDHCPILKAIKN